MVRPGVHLEFLADLAAQAVISKALVVILKETLENHAIQSVQANVEDAYSVIRIPLLLLMPACTGIQEQKIMKSLLMIMHSLIGQKHMGAILMYVLADCILLQATAAITQQHQENVHACVQSLLLNPKTHKFK